MEDIIEFVEIASESGNIIKIVMKFKDNKK
jgi:hypothetical protein